VRYFGVHNPIVLRQNLIKSLKLIGWQQWIQNTKYKLAPSLPGAEMIAEWGDMVRGAN